MAQTAPKDLFMALFYWLLVYYIALLPVVVKNYPARLVLLTIVVPNVLRTIVNRVPRLAVDRSFFFTVCLFALVVTYVFHQLFKKTRDDMDEFGKDVSKTLKVSGLLTASFIIGTASTYYLGLDRSIYSNLGWNA
ncbi:hypothetical protein [Dishui Lake phycodnavirus 2]|nr:hypothetical protein [Dishui Lake phycodnavirus 2]